MVFGCVCVLYNDALALVKSMPAGEKWPSNAQLRKRVRAESHFECLRFAANLYPFYPVFAANSRILAPLQLAKILPRQNSLSLLLCKRLPSCGCPACNRLKVVKRGICIGNLVFTIELKLSVYASHVSQVGT